MHEAAEASPTATHMLGIMGSRMLPGNTTKY